MKLIPIILAAGLMTACAFSPDVVYRYYPSKSNSTMTVTQTIDCNHDKTALIVVNSSTLNTAYTSDFTKGPYSLRIKDLDGTFADSDIGFNFLEDGRLKSINASSTGQGETIIKSAISLVTSLAPLGGGAPAAVGKAPPPLPECDFINSWGGGKPVTLTYSKNIDYGSATEAPINLDVAPGNKQLYTALQNRLPLLQVRVGRPSPIASAASYSSSSDSSKDTVLLTLLETANVKVDVLADGQVIWSGNVTIPGTKTYQLPIPKAALFGKQAFSLTLSEAGAITSVEYGKNTGAVGPLNVATSAATAAAPETTAAKAADTKAQADLIAQQQRLARCQAQPAMCQ